MENQTYNSTSEYTSEYNPEHREGPVARSIEQQTAKLPSDLFLWAALGSVGLSLGLQIAGRKEQSNFIGHWAPTFLMLGMYNKLVKLHGSDGTNGGGHASMNE